jgi:hypothetical protein
MLEPARLYPKIATIQRLKHCVKGTYMALTEPKAIIAIGTKRQIEALKALRDRLGADT